jgi:hypothetical protein
VIRAGALVFCVIAAVAEPAAATERAKSAFSARKP